MVGIMASRKVCIRLALRGVMCDALAFLLAMWWMMVVVGISYFPWDYFYSLTSEAKYL
jgi:hypothetical protein